MEDHLAFHVSPFSKSVRCCKVNHGTSFEIRINKASRGTVADVWRNFHRLELPLEDPMHDGHAADNHAMFYEAFYDMHIHLAQITDDQLLTATKL